MLTPMDIHNKEFKRGFRGYSEEDVDAFMNNIAGDYNGRQCSERRCGYH